MVSSMKLLKIISKNRGGVTCGAALLAPGVVLSSATCIAAANQGYSNLQIYAAESSNESNEKLLNLKTLPINAVTRTFVHSNYYSKTREYDYVILQVDYLLREKFTPFKLPSENEEVDPSIHFSENLGLHINTECEDSEKQLTKTMMCTSRENNVDDVLGTPLTYQGTLYGVLTQTNGNHAIYSKISEVIPWIHEVLNTVEHR